MIMQLQALCSGIADMDPQQGRQHIHSTHTAINHRTFARQVFSAGTHLHTAATTQASSLPVPAATQTIIKSPLF